MATAIRPAPGDNDLRTEMWSRDLGREHGFEPLVVEGTVPAALRGTLYRNGPGQFGQFGTRYSHPFESDGAMSAVRFEDGKAMGASKLHTSEGLLEERAAGKLQYGLSVPWTQRIRNNVRKRIKNTANTNVMMWQGRLFALLEAAHPTEVDPRDLSTIGATDLDVITGCFSAHPHRVASRNATYNFGLQYGRVTKLHTYELPDHGPARHLGALELPYAPMLHDFIATDTHLVFFVSPVRIHVPRMLLAIGSYDKLFQWKPELGTEVICIPIDRPDEPVRFTVDAFYQWHFANAFTRGNELVIDYVRYQGFDSFYVFADLLATRDTRMDWGHYHRARIDVAAKTLRSEALSDRPCESPTIVPGREGREHAIAYTAFDGLCAIGSIDTNGKVVAHELPTGQRATEPLYVDGYLLSLCHARDRAFVAIYDATHIPDGPVAKVWFDHHIPITFHGMFASA